MANVSVVTPRGILTGFTHLNIPDEYNGSKAYKAQLILDPQNDEAAAALVDQINTLAQATYEEGVKDLKAKGGKSIKQAKDLNVHTCLTEEYDQGGEETGRLILNMKANAEYERNGQKVDTQLTYVDSKAKPIKNNVPLIRTGSTVKISGALVPFVATGIKKAGCSFRIYAVQIIELSTGMGGAEGFGVEEGGFEAEEPEAAPEAPVGFTDEPEGFDDDGDF